MQQASKDTFNLLVFAGCRVRQPLQHAARAETWLNNDACGPVRVIHNAEDVLQNLAVLRGELDVPQDIRPLCNMSADLEAHAAAKDFSGVDVTLIELSTPAVMKYRGFVINQQGVRNIVFNPLRRQGGDIAQAVPFWFHKGLRDFNEEVRSKHAKILLDAIPDDLENAAQIRAVIEETRSHRSDIPGGLEKARNIVQGPIGVIKYIHRYMPDGRAIGWPAGFQEAVTTEAERLGFPVFDPSPAVIAYGPEKAFRYEKENHYVREFMPIMADELIGFARSMQNSHRNTAASGVR